MYGMSSATNARAGAYLLEGWNGIHVTRRMCHVTRRMCSRGSFGAVIRKPGGLHSEGSERSGGRSSTWYLSAGRFDQVRFVGGQQCCLERRIRRACVVVGRQLDLSAGAAQSQRRRGIAALIHSLRPTSYQQRSSARGTSSGRGAQPARRCSARSKWTAVGQSALILVNRWTRSESA
jgi:hypothetical protein